MSDADRPSVCSFESRRATEMGRLIERHGGNPTVVPSMQEVPLDDNTAAIEFSDRLAAGTIDVVVFMTGVGASTLQASLRQAGRFDAVLERLQSVDVIVRGPKPKAVLHEWGCRNALTVAEPNTWRELLELIDEHDLVSPGRVVAVQEYGVASTELYEALEQRGAQVLGVPVYRWKLPDDTTQLERAVRAIVARDYQALLFTSANQVRNLLTVAQRLGLAEQMVAAADDLLVASIGPTCSETLTAEGFTVGFEASPPKMGPLVRGVMEALADHRPERR